MIRAPRALASAVTALVALVALVACAAPASEPDDLPTPTPLSSPVLLPEGDTAWQVTGGGDFVHGVAVLCPRDTAILIEDEQALTGSDGTPVPSMTLIDGLVAYASSWSGSERPTGVAEGAGTYSLELGPDGSPAHISGTAIVTWYDAATGKSEQKPDSFEFDFTAIATPDYCAS